MFYNWKFLPMTGSDLQRKPQHLSDVLTAQVGKIFVPYGSQQNFCFAKTSFILELLAEIANMVRSKKMQKLFLKLMAVAIAFGTLFSMGGCYPVFLPKNLKADVQSEYRTKYFVVKPPKGRWTAAVGTLRFNVPHEGNLLAQAMPEMIKFYKVPFVWAVGLEKWPDFVITTYPLFDSERFNNDTRLIAEAVKTHFELSRKAWWTHKQTWTGKEVRVKTMPKLDSVNIGDKTFYKLSEVMADDGSIVTSIGLYYFTEDRAYIIYGDYPDIIKTFEPIKYKPPKEETLLEKALYLWYYGSLQELDWNVSNHPYPYLFEYSPEKVTQAFQNAINENPNNYISHLFFGIHNLTPKENFYVKVVAPKIEKSGDVERVLPEEMWEFDHYRFNQIWLVNKKDFYSYLLHGNFDDKAAIAEFEIALKINPDSYTARYFLSWLYLRNGEYEKAVSEYKKLLEKDPQDADALLMLGVAYKGMGLEKESEASFNALKKITRKGTLYDFLDKSLGPALARSLSEAIGRSNGIK